jgi:alkylated DNA repair dioxygenase AlkB
MQQELFNILEYPQGFRFTEEFISQEEEEKLLEDIKKLEFAEFIFRGYTAKRKVLSFGWHYEFETGKLLPGNPLPHYLLDLRKKVALWTKKNPRDFSEVLLTEYQPESVINWHRDVKVFEMVVGVSLGSECLLKLRPRDFGRARFSLSLPPPVCLRIKR